MIYRLLSACSKPYLKILDQNKQLLPEFHQTLSDRTHQIPTINIQFH